MFVLVRNKIFNKRESKSGIPRIDAITMIKSNTFNGIVKYFKFNAIISLNIQ